MGQDESKLIKCNENGQFTRWHGYSFLIMEKVDQFVGRICLKTNTSIKLITNAKQQVMPGYALEFPERYHVIRRIDN